MAPKTTGKRKSAKSGKKIIESVELIIHGLTVEANSLENEIAAIMKSNENIKANLKQLADDNQNMRTSIYRTKKEILRNKADWLLMENKYKVRVEETKKKCLVQHDELMIEMANSKQLYGTDNKRLKDIAMEQDTKIKFLKHEMNSISDWMKTRATLQKRVDDLRGLMVASAKEHEEVVFEVSRRFQGDKLKIKKAADQHISMVFQASYATAIRNLNSLTSHIQDENSTLTKLITQLLDVNKDKRSKVELAEKEYKEQKYRVQIQADYLTRSQAVLEAKEKKIAKQEEKSSVLENEIKVQIEEKRKERETIIKRMMDERAHWRYKLSQMEKELALCGGHASRTAECATNTASALRKRRQDNIVRTFLLSSLQYVRRYANEIRKREKREERERYTREMIEAMQGARSWPRVQPSTLGVTARQSVNVELEFRMTRSMTVLRQAAAPDAPPIQWTDLSWDERELVLRGLFVLMNPSTSRPAIQPRFCAQCRKRHSGSFCPYVAKPPGRQLCLPE